MLTFMHRGWDGIVFSNVTLKVELTHFPKGFVTDNKDSPVWRCAMCGWSCCDGREWMEPEEFCGWLVNERPALLKDISFYVVVCDECLSSILTPDELLQSLKCTPATTTVAVPVGNDL